MKIRELRIYALIHHTITENTFVSLSIGDHEVKVCCLAKLFLVNNGLLKVRYRYMESIECDCIVIDGRLELVVNRHFCYNSREVLPPTHCKDVVERLIQVCSKISAEVFSFLAML